MKFLDLYYLEKLESYVKIAQYSNISNWFVLIVADCLCEKNKRVEECTLNNGECKCVSFGSGIPVSCTTCKYKNVNCNKNIKRLSVWCSG